MMRELAHRTADSGRIEISLDWDSDTNEVTLTLADERGAEQVTIPGEDANSAYEHPYAYLAAFHRRSKRARADRAQSRAIAVTVKTRR